MKEKSCKKESNKEEAKEETEVDSVLAASKNKKNYERRFKDKLA